MVYQKSQTGWWLMSLLGLVSIGMVMTYFYQWGTNPLSAVPLLILLAILFAVFLLFYKLTLIVSPPSVKIQYGVGLIRITLPIEKLLDVETIRTPWYYGLGIRITPKGMLYNVQGLKALRLVYRNRGKIKTVMLGTPEPEALKMILEKHFSHE